jgi:uncharacterized protein with GYD domain
MPKYMVKASYTLEGLQGLKREGASGRAKAIDELVTSQGGSVESLYWAFGDDDAILIAELPDNSSAAAVALSVSASGAASCSTTVLLTAEEIDRAVQARVLYRPPGR